MKIRILTLKPSLTDQPPIGRKIKIYPRNNSSTIIIPIILESELRSINIKCLIADLKAHLGRFVARVIAVDDAATAGFVLLDRLDFEGFEKGAGDGGLDDDLDYGRRFYVSLKKRGRARVMGQWGGRRRRLYVSSARVIVDFFAVSNHLGAMNDEFSCRCPVGTSGHGR